MQLIKMCGTPKQGSDRGEQEVRGTAPRSPESVTERKESASLCLDPGSRSEAVCGFPLLSVANVLGHKRQLTQ